MGSKKRSARARERAAFEASLEGAFSAHDPFAQEQARIERGEHERAEAQYRKACASKNRYASRAEAEDTARDCAAHGVRGLHTYRCPYCNGWHLTSKPQRS